MATDPRPVPQQSRAASAWANAPVRRPAAAHTPPSSDRAAARWRSAEVLPGIWPEEPSGAAREEVSAVCGTPKTPDFLSDSSRTVTLLRLRRVHSPGAKYDRLTHASYSCPILPAFTSPLRSTT